MTKFNHMAGILIASLVLSACAHASLWREGLYIAEKDEMFQSLAQSQVILLGENHGLKTHRDQHLEILNSLRKQGFHIHVGLEFFYFPDQLVVEQFRRQEITETEFLKRVAWGSPSFDYYREQALFPDISKQEKTWALNAPRALTSFVARSGLESLSAELKQWMPPEFALGNFNYKQRFIKALGGGGHLSDPSLIDRYFAAQSIWDDTMAWNIQKILSQFPNSKLVVIVGEFHTQYGGGLGDRLRARGVQRVTTVSQLNTNGMSELEIQESVVPHPEYGPRADWIWAEPAVQ